MELLETASTSSSRPCTGPHMSSGSGGKSVKMKPPCKKKFQGSLDDLWSKIKTQEKELKSLQSSISIEKDEEVKSLKQQRIAISAQRKEISDEQDSLNKLLLTKKNNLLKLQPNIQYKSETHINGAISKLEYHLKTNNFRASEERKIVSEIDSLNRSKKTLAEYIALKDELNELKQRQATLRKDKNDLFGKLQSIKTQEDALRTQDLIKLQNIDKIKMSLDTLYQQKRDLHTEYSKQVQEFEHLKEERQVHSFIKRTIKDKSKEEPITQAQKWRQQQQLCQTLISYLHQFESTHPSSTPVSDATPVSPVAKQLDDGQTVYVIKKKDADCFASVQPNRKSKKRDKKRPQNKCLQHSAQVFEQFTELGLQPPSVVKETAVVIEQLKSKQKYFSRLAENPEIDNVMPAICELRSAGHNERNSAICKLILSDQMNNLNLIDDGYSEESAVESLKDEVENIEVPSASLKPSETCCSNSSDADSALAEEVKSIESPDIIQNEQNQFLNWKMPS